MRPTIDEITSTRAALESYEACAPSESATKRNGTYVAPSISVAGASITIVRASTVARLEPTVIAMRLDGADATIVLPCREIPIPSAL